MNKTVKRKASKPERMIIATIIAITVMTPIIALVLSSINLMNTKQITAVESDLAVLEQEISELEVKRQEKVTYDQVREYAAAGGLEKNDGRVQRVRVD